MDYATIANTIRNVVKTAVPENSDTAKYAQIPELDKQREIIVSHLKANYDAETNQQLSAKEFVDTAKTHANLRISEEGDREDIDRKIKHLESSIQANKEALEQSLKVRRILQILLATSAIVLGLYIVGGSFRFIHTLAFFTLLAGLMVAMYTRGEKTQWTFPWSK